METTPPESYDHGRDACYESKLFALSFELSPQRIAQAKFIENAAVVLCSALCALRSALCSLLSAFSLSLSLLSAL